MLNCIKYYNTISNDRMIIFLTERGNYKIIFYTAMFFYKNISFDETDNLINLTFWYLFYVKKFILLILHLCIYFMCTQSKYIAKKYKF